MWHKDGYLNTKIQEKKPIFPGKYHQHGGFSSQLCQVLQCCKENLSFFWADLGPQGHTMDVTLGMDGPSWEAQEMNFQELNWCGLIDYYIWSYIYINRTYIYMYINMNICLYMYIYMYIHYYIAAIHNVIWIAVSPSKAEDAAAHLRCWRELGQWGH